MRTCTASTPPTCDLKSADHAHVPPFKRSRCRFERSVFIDGGWMHLKWAHQRRIGLFSVAKWLHFGYKLSASILFNGFSIVLNGLQCLSIFSIKDMKVSARCADDRESVLTPNKSEPNDGVAPRAGNGLTVQVQVISAKSPQKPRWSAMATDGHSSCRESDVLHCMHQMSANVNWPREVVLDLANANFMSPLLHINKEQVSNERKNR